MEKFERFFTVYARIFRGAELPNPVEELRPPRASQNIINIGFHDSDGADLKAEPGRADISRAKSRPSAW